jgi:hypothetical protein
VLFNASDLPRTYTKLNLLTPRNTAALRSKANFVVIYIDLKYPRNLCILRSRDRPVPGLAISLPSPKPKEMPWE